MDQTQVELRVGRDRVPIMVHKELLCYYSEFFRGAFEGGFRESEEKSLRLANVDLRIFRLCQHWLYAQASRRTAEPEQKKADRSKSNNSTRHVSNGSHGGVPEWLKSKGIRLYLSFICPTTKHA
jgi:hypothetical protein